MASNKTVLTSAQKAARSSSFGSELPERPHTLTREVDDLRSDVEAAFARLESHGSIPVIYANNIILKNADSDVSADASIHGANLLCGQTQASVTINDITFTVSNPGVAGNAYSVEITQGAGALDVSFANDVLTVELDVGNSTNTEVADAVNAGANKFNATVNANANANANAVVAAASSASGGIGAGVQLLIHSAGSSVDFSADIASLSDSQIGIVHSNVAFVTAPAVGSVGSVMLKNLNNSAMSHPSPTLPTIA